MLLKHLISPLTDLPSSLIIMQEPLDLSPQIFRILDLNCSLSLSQETGDFSEVGHVWSEEDAFLEKKGFKRVLPTQGDKAPSNKNEFCQAVELDQFSHGIKEDDIR